MFSKKIGEGQFGFAFDLIPGHKTDAKSLRLEWREQKKDVKISNETENYVVCEKVLKS